VITAQEAQVVNIDRTQSSLTVSSLQPFLDALEQAGSLERIDYVHGADVVFRLGQQNGNAGFYLPAVPKDSLFRTVILEGTLPLKTFSIGEARQKRFYLESRRITL
jgi:hypothetical protein